MCESTGLPQRAFWAALANTEPLTLSLLQTCLSPQQGARTSDSPSGNVLAGPGAQGVKKRERTGRLWGLVCSTDSPVKVQGNMWRKVEREAGERAEEVPKPLRSRSRGAIDRFILPLT